jgi:hypothetical protein
MPCVAELPHLVQVAAEFAAEGGRVIGISQDLFVPGATPEDALPKVARLLAARNVRYPNLVLDAPTLDGLNERYDLPGPIPCTLAFDADGNEVDRQEDDADLERFRQMMRRALGKEPPAKR